MEIMQKLQENPSTGGDPLAKKLEEFARQQKIDGESLASKMESVGKAAETATSTKPDTKSAPKKVYFIIICIQSPEKKGCWIEEITDLSYSIEESSGSEIKVTVQSTAPKKVVVDATSKVICSQYHS